MSQTPNFNLDYLMPEQAQKHVTVNDALRRLDGLVHLSVKNRTSNSPPSAPRNGERYLVAASPRGAWSARAGQLALFEDTAWHFFAPQAGWRLWDEASSHFLVYDGRDWQNLQSGELSTPPSPGESSAAVPSLLREKRVLVDVTDMGEVTIPSHKIFLGLTARVVESINGTPGWRLGVDDDTKRFGHGLSVAANSEMRGPADPSVIYWQDTQILVSPEGGRFTAGQILLALFYVDLPVPPPPT